MILKISDKDYLFNWTNSSIYEIPEFYKPNIKNYNSEFIYLSLLYHEDYQLIKNIFYQIKNYPIILL